MKPRDPERRLQLAQAEYEETVGVVGDDHPDALDARTQLAFALNAVGRHSEAIRMQSAVQDRRRELRGETYEALVAANDLALIHKSAGNLDVARALQEQVLDRVLAWYGELNEASLAVMVNLSNTLRESGDFAASTPLVERAWEASKTLNGAHAELSIRLLSTLAQSSRAIGDDEKADQLIRLLNKERADRMVDRLRNALRLKRR
jgi:tetratricopeptide (TPR) repeat protein